RLAILSRGGAEQPPSASPPMKPSRSPIRISSRLVVDLIRSGTDDAGLMKRFNLSAKALHSLLDQLVDAGALNQSEVNERGSLSPGTVAIDVTNLTLPDITKERPVIRAAEAVKCIRTGMDDAAIMSKYGISARGLRSLFRKLVASGAIAQHEIDQRMSQTHDWAVLDDGSS
ncbi:MAG: hypothetical protein V2B18_15035, partial [Pseudomonadota bacterium]